MRIGSVSGIAGRGDSSLIRPVPDAQTLPFRIFKVDNIFQVDIVNQAYAFRII